MTQTKTDIKLNFRLPEGDHDIFEISDAIWVAGYPDAVIGSGNLPDLTVLVEPAGDHAAYYWCACREIHQALPEGTALIIDATNIDQMERTHGPSASGNAAQANDE